MLPSDGTMKPTIPTSSISNAIYSTVALSSFETSVPIPFLSSNCTEATVDLSILISLPNSSSFVVASQAKSESSL